MRARKPSADRTTDKTVIQGKGKAGTHSKGNGFTKRRPSNSNKENIVQITEPLDPSPSVQQCKQFMLSRDSLARTSRGNLKDIKICSNFVGGESHMTTTGPLRKGYVTEQFDRRLSLKCLDSHSQQFETQKSQRLSMLPPRRESMGGCSAVPPSLLEERESLCSAYPPSVASCQYTRPQVQKEKIITNLVHKLEQEDDLRSIIESKLKNGQPVQRDRKNQSYLTDYTEETGSHSMAQKLRHCQNEIRQFKSLIRDLSQKMNQPRSSRERYQDSQGLSGELLTLFRNMSNGRCVKQCRTVGTQTERERETRARGGQLMDNIERTLQALK